MVTRELLRNNISRSNRIESNIRKVPVYRPQNDTISIPPDSLNLARNVIFARANCLSRTFVIFRFDPSMANEKAGRSRPVSRRSYLRKRTANHPKLRKNIKQSHWHACGTARLLRNDTGKARAREPAVRSRQTAASKNGHARTALRTTQSDQ